MPWTAWPGGSFSWGHNPFALFGAEDRYLAEAGGDPLRRLDRLKRLVSKLHRRSMHVLMGGVFNHVESSRRPDGTSDGRGFAYHWLYQDPARSPFTGGFGQGGSFEDLDHNNRCTAQLVADRRAHLAATGRDNVTLTLEHMADNRYEAIDVANTVGDDGCWYHRFLWDVPEAASRGMGTALVLVLDAGQSFADGRHPVTYVENHDHSTLVNWSSRARCAGPSSTTRPAAGCSPSTASSCGCARPTPPCAWANFHPRPYDARLERFIVVLNFSHDQWTDIPFPTNGVWTDLLDGDSVDVGGFRLTGQRINSNWGRIYHQAA